MKFFYRNWGKVTKQTDSDWRTYKTSSKYVKEAIEKYGLEYFTFEVIQLFDTRAGVVSGEIEALWNARVLSEVDSNNERTYWNNAIGNIKFITKEHLSEETRARISKGLTGITRSEETKSKIAAASAGNKNNLGKTLSDTTKEKIRAKALGRPNSEEAKAKMSLAKLGSTLSEETKLKMANSQKKRRENENKRTATD